MVDELQDTNQVQLELIESIAHENLFTVGDAQQSIYGFRHADVEQFERRGASLAALGARATLDTNFRSRPEILAVINGVFERALSDRFRPLRAGRVTWRRRPTSRSWSCWSPTRAPTGRWRGWARRGGWPRRAPWPAGWSGC